MRTSLTTIALVAVCLIAMGAAMSLGSTPSRRPAPPASPGRGAHVSMPIRSRADWNHDSHRI